MSTRSTLPWKNDVSYVFSLHKLNIMYLREGKGENIQKYDCSMFMINSKNLSLCLASRKADTFSIGFLGKIGGYGHELTNTTFILHKSKLSP